MFSRALRSMSTMHLLPTLLALSSATALSTTTSAHSTDDALSMSAPHRGLLDMDRCGGVGAPPCTDDFLDNGGCFPGLAANNVEGICIPDVGDVPFPCSLENQQCCAGTCARRLNCNSRDRCVRCGGLDEPECDNLEEEACAEGLIPEEGRCRSERDSRPCGSRGQSCCDGNVCRNRHDCISGTCKRCGGRRQTFCPWQVGCSGRLRVRDGTCERVSPDESELQPDCGLVGEPVCEEGMGCEPGLQAYNAICLPALNLRKACGVPDEACCAGVTCARSLSCTDGICVRP